MSEWQFEEEEFVTGYSGKTFLRIFSLLKKHIFSTLGFILTVVLISLIDGVFTFITKHIIDEGVLSGNKARLLELLLLYGGFALLIACIVFIMIYLAGTLGERVQYDIRKNLFNHLQSLSFSYFNRTPVGWIISRVTSDSTKIAQLVTWGMLDFLWSILNIITSMTFMMIINWKMGLIVMLIFPVMILFAILFQKHILGQFRKVRKMNSKITGAYNESITGVRVVKSLCREELNLESFSEKSEELYNASYKAAWLSALFLPVIQITGSLALGAVLWYGGVQQLNGEMTFGGIQAFISYITIMLWPVQQLARVWASMQNSLASAERVFSLMESVPEIVDKDNAIDPESLKCHISFNNIDFAYEKNKPLFRNFSLEIPRGMSIALVGHTGCGKSSIVNLLCRFYEPEKGEILFGGVDYRNYTQLGLQSRIGIVLQDPLLFSGSIRENIRYGRLDASDKEVEEAARTAQAHDFICSLENGYEEEVGEGGSRLSVGQKQLVSLARAILADPDIFIMDEATSSIDALTESAIQEAQKRIFQGRTSIVIAHRLSTIKMVDRIVVLEKGQIIETGNHEELMKKKGKYFSLYSGGSQGDIAC